jgi:hypothetical protein
MMIVLGSELNSLSSDVSFEGVTGSEGEGATRGVILRVWVYYFLCLDDPP